ncbi:MAG: nucleoside triphosphate pyrophosphatase [Desulfobacterales bacterium]|jgi:septum formation protein
MKKPHDRPKLILASKSPRRKDLLEQAGLKFSIIPSDFDESSVRMSDPESYVQTLAKAKAIDISEKYADSWVLGADTIVLIDASILGKPGSKEEARFMLKRLSGKMHQVITGYCLCRKVKKDIISGTVKTNVQFKTLRDAEIEWYIQTGEPFDKAGAYAIQGIGAFLVKSIDGSYTNVVGLPVCEVIEHLISEGVVELNLESH